MPIADVLPAPDIPVTKMTLLFFIGYLGYIVSETT
jgi:hypothetical protein